MKPIVWTLAIAAIAYGSYNFGIPYLMSQAALSQAGAQNAPTATVTGSPSAQGPTTSPTPAPSVGTAPVAAAPKPADTLDAAPLQKMNPAGAATLPAATAPVHMTCATNVAAFDPNSPVQQLGWFKAGSDLEVSDCPKITGMKNVSFKDTSGQIIHAVCFEKDLNRTTQEVAATTPTEQKPVVEMPKPLTYKPRNWTGEPNWHSVYDDPAHHMMTDKHGNINSP